MEMEIKSEPEELEDYHIDSEKLDRVQYWNRMEEEDQLLVQLVQQFPFLYDRELKEFKDHEMKLDAWRSIGDMMNISHEAATSRWKVIRERYAREKRQQALLPDGTKPPPSNWRMYHTMKFLEKHVKPRSRNRSALFSAKLEKTKSVAATQDLSAEGTPAWHTVTPVMEPTIDERPTYLIVQSPEPVRSPSPDSQSFSGQSTSPPRKKPRKTIEQSLSDAVDIVKSTSQQLLLKSNGKTEDYLFAQSIAKSIVGLLSRCSRKQRHKKKIAILQLINDLDSDDDF